MTSRPGPSNENPSKPGPSSEDPSVKAEQVVDIPAVKKTKYPPAGKSDKILENLHLRRHSGELCDIRLKISQAKTVHAHKSILASCSVYFEGMFMGAFMESTSDTIDLSHITDRDDVLENVIDTFYGRQFEINEDNVSDVINLATMFLIDDLKMECNNVLIGIAHVRNAAEMLQLSLNFDLRELREKVLPMIKFRFHDYIMFQDDLFDLSVEGFQLVISNINTRYISRRGEYIQFILRWFLICESDERSNLLKRAIESIRFKVTKHVYRKFEEQLEDVINHLDDANSDVSYEMKCELSKCLPTLKPNDYVKNPSQEPSDQLGNNINENIVGAKTQDNSDSDYDEEPKREPYNTFGAKQVVYGPPTKKKGFTEKEEREWEKAHEEMANRDQHRIWAEKWPFDPLNKLGTHDDPNRPKFINREGPQHFYWSRKFRVKSDAELREEANLVDALVVLAPSKEYLKNMESKDQKTNDYIEDILDVCAYIPRKNAWFKITSLSTSSIRKRFDHGGGSAPFRDRHGWDDSDSDDDEEAMHLAAMMDMYGPDMPEMIMMMRGMPRSRRRRLLEEAARGRMPPSMLRRMMEMDMDMDEDDIHRFEYMMMRDMARMHPRFRGRFGMRMMRNRQASIPSLSDPKWNAVYLKHRLYFYHQDIRGSVFCYDILTQNWFKTTIIYTRDKPEDGTDIADGTDITDGIELIVMGQILYAVLRVAVFDQKRNHYFKTSQDRKEESKRQVVFVKHAVYKLIGELADAKWEKVVENFGNDEYISIDEEHRIDPEKETYRHSMDYFEEGNHVRQSGAMKTLLYAEDEEKLFVCCLVRKRFFKDESIVAYSITNMDIIYLDLKRRERVQHSPDKQWFLRTLTPLYSDDLVVFVNDDLKTKAMLDLGMPEVWHTGIEWGYTEPETRSEYLEARSLYPRCPSILLGASDGKSLWILRGNDNDTSETLEVYATMFHPTRKCQTTTVSHPPPPFRCFTLAMVAKMSKLTIRTLGLPTKYLHTA